MPIETRAPSCTTEEYNELLAIAALFEGPFSIDWIQEITCRKATQVLCAFEKAVQEGLLKRDQIGSFAFTNAKTQKKWHSRLPSSEIPQYYRLITDMLIQELPESDTKPQQVAPYLLNITNEIENCKLLMAAAAKFHAEFRIETALQCYSKVIDDLAGLSGRDSDQLFCDAALQYSKLTTARHETKRVLSILEEAMLRARNQGSYKYQTLLDMHFAKNKWLQSQYGSALKHFDQAWHMARDLDDEQLLRSAATFKTFFLFWQGRFRDAVLDYEKSVSDVDKFPHGRFPLLATMTIGTCYGKIGQVSQGIGMIDSVRRQCLEKGDIGLAAHSGICIGAIMLDNGYVDEACRHLIPSVKEARQVHPDWTVIQGELVLAYAYYLQGRYERCRTHLRTYSRHAQQMQVSVRTWPYYLELAWAIAEGKLPATPGVSIQEEIKRMLKGENVFLKGVAYRFQYQLQKKEGQPAQRLIKTLEQAIQSLQASGHATELAKSRLALAREYLLQGNRKGARDTAAPAFKVLSATNQNLIPDDLKALAEHTTAADTRFKDIVRFTNELTAIKKSKDVIQHIISTANRMVGAERGALFLCEGPGHPLRFQLRASKNLTREQIAQPAFDSSLKLMSEVVTGGTGLVKENPAEPTAPPSGETNILSCICVPLMSDQQIIGTLYHDNRLLSSAFDETQLETLRFFAAQTALALEGVQVQNDNRHLHKRLKELTAHYEKQSFQAQSPHFEEVIGTSPGIKKVLAEVHEVARTDATILILGETGVGKEMIAKAVQQNSDRRHKPFISLNCNALSETLIYSEFFGHEKGAFTGADHRHVGRFEKAHQGTLFLDEIGDLPMDVQVRLLRVLETKEFERVGGRETMRSDFRLICATNSDLVRAVKKKKFRQDLYYRINVFTIFVPPLRERREDIPLLVEHFLKQQAIETGKICPPVTDREMRRLMQHPWPGNVRELKNITERYAISSPASQIRIVELLDSGKQQISGQPRAITLRENERRHILWALRETGGKVHGPGGAAELLDLHPNTLSFRMKKHNIQKQPIGNRKGR